MATNQRRLAWKTAIILLVFLNDCHGFQPSRGLARPVRNITPYAGVVPLHAASQLYYRDGDDDLSTPDQIAETPSVAKTSSSQIEDPHQATDTSSVSMPLINSIWFNQLTLFLLATLVAVVASFFGSSPLDLSGLHWNGGADTSFFPFFDWRLTWFRLAEGILATIPMVTLGCIVENSDDRNASQVNFSTTNMVISLFGRRKSVMEPMGSRSYHVMLLSAGIALSTGISEEIIFRGFIPTAIFSSSHSWPLALLGQAALFSAGHLSRKSRPGENRLVGLLQFFNGLWYGSVYFITGGDILPCIVAHILYDMHILCETWTFINTQMDYSQKTSQTVLDQKEERAIRQLQEGGGAMLNAETVSFARRFFYAFDYGHVGSLSLADCQRAVTYAFMNDKVIPPPQTVADLFRQVQQGRSSLPIDVASTGGASVAGIASTTPSDRLTFSEFLQVLYVLRSSLSAKSL
jgi:membrane protease YdiL (CAAX protease family)